MRKLELEPMLAAAASRETHRHLRLIGAASTYAGQTSSAEVSQWPMGRWGSAGCAIGRVGAGDIVAAALASR